MSLHRNVLFALLAVCVLAGSFDGGMFPKFNVDQKIKTELDYYKQAAALNDLLFREGTPVNTNVVVKTLKEIDKNILVFYPKGPFTRNDFITLGWLESEFRQYERGTHGERGIFQIMPCEFNDFDIHKNYYDVDVNTQMAFRVMDGKYQKHKDYKLAIMAYNGLIKTHSGNYSQKYWKSFEKRKIAVELVLNNQ
jgi:hypothetical protein